ncbi:hypothetical protein L226DRAFT_564151 [Lentinus tigrinus ALCF2SS1-7]|uniref:Uncharacterized protein n=1 Tax=Lentinus tigrinus ALCF2SS1-6 TaxID=1328759 RepID=A0A5C2RS29_9APHY|nr:hypothetical protein L227DRAFT_604070 [Lentinus tigrinus ALCF2SS1-6]RPD67835.1 hypothetical protein L226DRAFT_564151 [Lentinus tigrinus ALCF2SS1-7]
MASQMVGTTAGDAAVVSRAIVWVGDLTDQQKSDVLESTLFAQAAADKQHSSDNEDNTQAWYTTYTNTLGSIGWVVGKAEFTEVNYDKTQGSVDDTVLEQLAKDASVSKELYAGVARALLAFARTESDSDAQQVFDSAAVASSSEFASFQIAIASVDDNANVILTLLAWFYTSNQKVKNALWFSWQNATLNIKTSTLTMTLNNDIYSKVRFTIHDKLQGADKLDHIVPL